MTLTTAALSAIRFFWNNRANPDVAGTVPEQFAAWEAVLSDEEKELGVALVDIGGETTDIAIFIDGAIA